MVNQIHPKQIFAHRGAWDLSHYPGNSNEALLRAVSEGFALETDIRDSGGAVVISHDPPSRESRQTNLLDFLQVASGPSSHATPMALNVKSDGLSPLLQGVNDLSSHLPKSSYFFDMSIPETLRFSLANLPFAVRVSEYEPAVASESIVWPSEPAATWVDGFHRDWFLERHGSWLLRESEKRLVTIVSPELHGRDPSAVLDWFLEHAGTNPNLTICTDVPWEYLNA